jgi:hypothetical protein
LSRAKSYKQKHSASLGNWRAIMTQTICRCSDNAKLRANQCCQCFPHIRSAILKKSQARKTNANSHRSPIKTPSFLLLQNGYHSGGNMTSNTKRAGTAHCVCPTPVVDALNSDHSV